MKHICITGYNSFIGKNFYKKYKNAFKILPYKKNINNLNEIKRFIQNKKITHLVNFAGLSRETVSRIITELKSEGYLSTTKFGEIELDIVKTSQDIFEKMK